jgi:hypothetical protein
MQGLLSPFVGSFKKLYERLAPQENPKCPAHVRCAKLINRQLVQMIDGLTGGSDRSNSGEDESELEDALEDPQEIWRIVLRE